ncbi:uncharacterized protein TNIN_416871 [Trichonephila inaurata madagascariensis]|uniref:Uncharacterized protein n=1 Tax=Trichonephila inaurata madagascariensis TaxID=2747483 RepID=A0A8X6YI50_9ARAC|nr:uncharacterized protein TNIN_416871 [Trichonephila inaurata madagascariensis]
MIQKNLGGLKKNYYSRIHQGNLSCWMNIITPRLPLRIDSKKYLMKISYNLSELLIMIQGQKKFQELSGFLRSTSDELESRRNFSKQISVRSGHTKSTLENLYPKYNNKYKILMRHIAEWKPQREEVIEKLSSYIYQLDRNFKYCTIARLLASSVEVSGTVGEVDQTKKILDEVSTSIENDHKLLQPVVKWFEKTEELNSIVQELFPHGIDTDIVQQIQAASEEQEDYLGKIFKGRDFNGPSQGKKGKTKSNRDGMMAMEEGTGFPKFRLNPTETPRRLNHGFKG